MRFQRGEIVYENERYGNTYIVDRLFDRAALLLGSGKHQVKVELVRQAEVGGGKAPAPTPQAQAASGGAEAGAKP